MGPSVCILDTSILCELVRVPNLAHDFESVTLEMEKKVQRKENLLLPLSAILETGNHIGQNGNGHQRREAARRFVDVISSAVRGEAPFVPISPFAPDTLVEWLQGFPEWVKKSDGRGKGSGLGDLTIVKEWEKRCSLHPHARVYIWSLDRHLKSYDRAGKRL